MLSLLRLSAPYSELMSFFSPKRAEPQERAWSPRGASTLMTSAPKSPSVMAHIGPEVWDAVGAFFGAVVNLLVAMAPVGEQILNALVVLFEVIAAMPPDLLRSFVIGIMTFVFALQALSGIGVLLTAIGTALSVIGAIMIIPFGAAILVIGAVLVALTALWLGSETFRDIVTRSPLVLSRAFLRPTPWG